MEKSCKQPEWSHTHTRISCGFVHMTCVLWNILFVLLTVHKFGIFVNVLLFLLLLCLAKKKASHGIATNENTRNILKDRNKPKEVIIKLTSKSKSLGGIFSSHTHTIVTYKWDRILIIMPFKSRCQLSEITANRKRCFFGNFVAAAVVVVVFSPFYFSLSLNFWYYAICINKYIFSCTIVESKRI